MPEINEQDGGQVETAGKVIDLMEALKASLAKRAKLPAAFVSSSQKVVHPPLDDMERRT